MGQAKRRKEQLGALYGTPEGSNRLPVEESSPDEVWARIERMTQWAQRCTFVVGQVWLSPGFHHFEVVHVSPEGRARMNKLGPGWTQTVEISWNSPKLNQWQLLSHPPA